ncbi:MAG: flavin reductase family protein, partial [Rubrivivax sp.]|nr:flavin reductase family protein [Rubrivivax sp.]
MDSRQLRSALGRFTTGVTVVTCCDAQGRFVGLTANSFNALSLEPPLVLWSLRSASPSMAAFEAAPRFAVNVLAEAQVELSRRFASRTEDRFAEGVWALGE